MESSTLVAYLIQGGVCAAGLAAWAYIIGRLVRGGQLLPFEPRRPVPWSGVDLLLVAAAFLVSIQIALQVAFRLMGIGWPEDWETANAEQHLAQLAGGLVATVLAMNVALLIVIVRARATAEDLGIVLRPALRDIAAGSIAFAAAAPVVYFVQFAFQQWAGIEYGHPLIEALQADPDTATISIVVLAAIVVAPLCEEFVLRVLLQGWLEKKEQVRFGESPGGVGLFGLPIGAAPVIGSSIVFALLHLGHGAAAVPLFVYALVLGYMYRQTHRLLPSLVAHLLLNAVSTAMLIVTL